MPNTLPRGASAPTSTTTSRPDDLDRDVTLPLALLSEAARETVDTIPFLTVLWDRLEPEQRIHAFLVHDLQQDPDAETLEEFAHEVQNIELEAERDEIERMRPTNITEVVAKNKLLQDIQTRLDTIGGSAPAVSEPTRIRTNLIAFLDWVRQDIDDDGKRLTAGNLKIWLNQKRAVSARPDFEALESGFSDFDEIYMDGNTLVWTDRNGLEHARSFRSLEPYMREVNAKLAKAPETGEPEPAGRIVPSGQMVDGD